MGLGQSNHIMVFSWSNKLHCKYFVKKTHRVKHYVLKDHFFISYDIVSNKTYVLEIDQFCFSHTLFFNLSHHPIALSLAT